MNGVNWVNEVNRLNGVNWVDGMNLVGRVSCVNGMNWVNMMIGKNWVNGIHLSTVLKWDSSSAVLNFNTAKVLRCRFATVCLSSNNVVRIRSPV